MKLNPDDFLTRLMARLVAKRYSNLRCWLWLPREILSSNKMALCPFLFLLQLKIIGLCTR